MSIADLFEGIGSPSARSRRRKLMREMVKNSKNKDETVLDFIALGVVISLSEGRRVYEQMREIDGE